MTTIIADPPLPFVEAEEIVDVLTLLTVRGIRVATSRDLQFIFGRRPGLRGALRAARRTGQIVHLIDHPRGGVRVEHVALTANRRHLPGGGR